MSDDHPQRPGPAGDEPGADDLLGADDRARGDDRAGSRAHTLASAVRAAGTSGAAVELADRVCEALAGVDGVQGASLCVLFMPGMSVPAGVSDARAARAEELQFSSGEGPCWQAYSSGQVVITDLTDATVARLWPSYTRAIREQVGYDRVVAVPLHLGPGLLVVANVYERRDVVGWWSQAAVFAEALRQVLQAATPSGSGASTQAKDAATAKDRGVVWLDASSTVRRGTVWVAEAVLREQVPGLDLERAQAALRTYSVIEGGTVDEVAAALVRGHLSVQQVLGRD